MSFTQNDISSLADKLAQLDLTEAESAVLRNLSGEDEVSGFSMFDFSPLSLRLGPPKNETFVGKPRRDGGKGIILSEEQESI